MVNTANAGARWTEEMDRQLVDLLKENKSLEVIADTCGRTPTAILSRMGIIAEQAVQFARLKKLIAENL